MEDIRKSVMSVCPFDGPCYRLEYPWVWSDGGRSQSKRPRQKDDCTVRALAIACAMPYDEAYDILAQAGRKCSRGFPFAEWINCQPWATKIAFPAVKGQRRMNPSSFVSVYPSGTYICKVAKHVFAVIDGVLYDTSENPPDRCIYTAWAVKAI